MVDRVSLSSLIVTILLIAGGGWLLFRSNGDGLQTSTSNMSGMSVTDEPFQTKALNLSFKNLSGETVHLADFKGKPIVINSWSVWCPFCADELSSFAKVQQEFGDRVVIVAIDRAETKSVVQKFSDDAGIGDTLVLLLDPEDSFYQYIGGFSMPETVFIDASGQAVFHKRGPMQLEEIRQRVADLLQ